MRSSGSHRRRQPSDFTTILHIRKPSESARPPRKTSAWFSSKNSRAPQNRENRGQTWHSSFSEKRGMPRLAPVLPLGETCIESLRQSGGSDIHSSRFRLQVRTGGGRV